MTDKYERLFFALWPDEPVRQQLSDSLAGLEYLSAKGRLVRPSNLHMTIHFLGNIPVQSVRCFLRQATEVQGSSFNINMTHLGHFKKPRVLWIGCESIPPALSRLHTDLGSAIEACGYTQESRPYNPHVTMARKINQLADQPKIPEIHWSVDRFVLIQSINQESGVHYKVRASFPLRG